jgi:hypothetical protein
MKHFLLNVFAFLAVVVGVSAQAFNRNTDNLLDIAYFKEDVCWSSELDGCDVVGFNLEYSTGFENYYLLGSLGHFFSKHKKDPRGDPLLNATTIAFGIGKEFYWLEDSLEDLTVAFECLVKLQADDDFGNSNSNSGSELRLRLAKGIADSWQAGFEIILQRFQNCSHPDCHKLGARKPVMQNTVATVFISYQAADDWGLTYKVFDVIDLPDRDLYNGRDPESLGQTLELNLLFE